MLAHELGWCSVDDMRRGMSAGEWLQWWVYFARQRQREELAAARGR